MINIPRVTKRIVIPENTRYENKPVLRRLLPGRIQSRLKKLEAPLWLLMISASPD
jgi:hypothetical protein